jgi:phage terminase large subunit-like protein
MNIFVDGDIAEVYVSAEDLKKCKLSTYDWHGKEVYLGVDLSQTTDNTSVSMVTYDKDLQKFVTKVWAWLPEENVDNKTKIEKVDYRMMNRQGFCFFSGDKVINHKDIEDFVLALEKTYGVKIKDIGYDRWNAIGSANRWDEEGLNVTEVKQHSSVLHPATKFLKEKIMNEEFAYVYNQLFEINVANAREVKDNNLNSYVNKRKSRGRIDMLAATINAMYLWNNEMVEGESVYTERGLLTL